MSDQIKLIAARLKVLREISGLSPESMAYETGVTVDLYREYEGGGVDIPVGFLYEVAKKFRVELTAILTGDDPKLHSFSIVKDGSGVVVERKQQYHYESLAYNFTDKKAEPFLVTVSPETKDDEVVLSSHPGQEFNYMVEGRLRLFIDNHEIILDKGDSLYFDSKLKHGMVALDDKPAKILAIIMQ
ncbi:MAG TPA: XRE family transcriptional regulator [Anaerovoracaceae bacterium]|nr:XRE family transcriptional regulator [Anaerovoracaceae bacterium]